MTPFPWDEAMRFGLGVLKLPPDTFWKMTPRELAAAIAGARGAVPQPPSRKALAALIERFPDRRDVSNKS